MADDPNLKGRKIVREAKKVISAYSDRFFRAAEQDHNACDHNKL
jgi:hypothetical protein